MYALAMTCNSGGGGNNPATAITELDNNSHNNCVEADKAAWAIDKIHFFTDEYCTEGKQTLTFLGEITQTETDKQDFAGNPTLGSGSMPHGTYKCMAVRIWDNVTCSPSETTDGSDNSTAGACVAANDYTTDLCGGGTGGEALVSYWDPGTGASANCTIDSSPASEWIWVYLSTASTDLDADDECVNCDWNPPTSDNLTKGITLGGALVISAAKTSIFKTDISNRIADESVWAGGGGCSMLKPAFTFE
jgi:hypothetical protein